MPTDFNNWPVWMLFVLVIINIFKQQIGSFLPTALRDYFQQHVKRKVNRDEYGQLRESWREEQLVDMLNRRDAWIQGELAAEIKELKYQATRMNNEQIRTNSLLTGINGNLTKLIDTMQERSKTSRWP